MPKIDRSYYFFFKPTTHLSTKSAFRLTSKHNYGSADADIGIDDISEQLARDTFEGPVSGHVEGSRAFSRYRTIDMDMKMDLVKILEGAK